MSAILLKRSNVHYDTYYDPAERPAEIPVRVLRAGIYETDLQLIRDIWVPAGLEELLLSVAAIRSILHDFGKSRGEFPLNVPLGDRTISVQGRVLDLSRS